MLAGGSEYCCDANNIVLGWKVVLSPRVPKLSTAAIPAMFTDLVTSVPELMNTDKVSAPQFDWALHPGGSTVISGVQRTMGLTEQHLRASYEVYMNHGNSSSATIFSVLSNLLKGGEGNDHVVGVAFGPGIAVEMVIFKRYQGSRSGTESPDQYLEAEDVD
jgi:type III polyketide synthase